MLSKEGARRSAEEFLDAEVRPRFRYGILVVEDGVEESEDAWIFPYDGQAYVELGDWRQAMAGNSPIVVDKLTGEARFLS
ncbi:YrhB domain-containing protein [Micromonospora sp. NPDC005686]|uniref:YrhB domain-containing protein n=1 Tax=unclassified Micromonospora TaxID=2617518 RepID=UPI0033AFB9FA